MLKEAKLRTAQEHQWREKLLYPFSISHSCRRKRQYYCHLAHLVCQSKNISELKKCVYLLNQRLLILESSYRPRESTIQQDLKQVEPSTVEEFRSNPKNRF
jgi:hypothetical protein